MVLRALAIAGLLTACLAPTPTLAVPFTYDEAINGDLTDSTLSAPAFPLAAGLNTVSGTAFHTPTGFDFDQFAFAVPEGHALTNITFFYEVSLIPGTEALATYYQLLDGPPFAADTTMLGRHELFLFVLPPFTIAPSPSDLFTAALPVGAGTYWMFNEALSRGGSDDNTGGEWSYRWELSVAAVPLPESSALSALGAALLMFAACRRRRAVS